MDLPDPEWYHFVAILGGAALLCCCIVFCSWRCSESMLADHRRALAVEEEKEHGARQFEEEEKKVREEDRQWLRDTDAATPYEAGVVEVAATEEMWEGGGFYQCLREQAKEALATRRAVGRMSLEGAEGRLRVLHLTRPTPQASLGIYLDDTRPVVGKVGPATPADHAGVAEGMRIVAVDGVKVYSSEQAIEALSKSATGAALLVDMEGVIAAGQPPPASAAHSFEASTPPPPSPRGLLPAAVPSVPDPPMHSHIPLGVAWTPLVPSAASLPPIAPPSPPLPPSRRSSKQRLVIDPTVLGKPRPPPLKYAHPETTPALTASDPVFSPQGGGSGQA